MCVRKRQRECAKRDSNKTWNSGVDGVTDLSDFPFNGKVGCFAK